MKYLIIILIIILSSCSMINPISEAEIDFDNITIMVKDVYQDNSIGEWVEHVGESDALFDVTGDTIYIIREFHFGWYSQFQVDEKNMNDYYKYFVKKRK